jgi:chromosome segregation ATPase
MELEENDGFEQEKMISRRRSMSAAVMASSDCINLLDDNNNNNTRVGSFRKQEITSASRQNALVSAEKLDMLTSAANLDIRLAHPISSQSSDVLMGTFEQLLEEYTRHHGSSVSINRSVKYEEGSLLEKFRDFALKLEFFIKQKENEIHTLKSAYNATRNDLTFHELSKSSAEFGVFEFKERIRAQRDAILSLRKDTVEKESTILQLEIQNQELKGQIGALQSALEYKDLYIMSLENKQLQEEQYEAAIASPVKSPLKKALLDPSLCEDDEVSLSRPRSPSRGSTFQLDFQNSNIFASEISSPAKTLHRKQSIASATSTVESVVAEEYEEITELVSSPTIEEEPQSVLVLHFGHSHLLCGLYTDGSNPNRSVSGFSNRSDITLVKIPVSVYISLSILS